MKRCLFVLCKWFLNSVFTLILVANNKWNRRDKWKLSIWWNYEEKNLPPNIWTHFIINLAKCSLAYLEFTILQRKCKRSSASALIVEVFQNRITGYNVAWPDSIYDNTAAKESRLSLLIKEIACSTFDAGGIRATMRYRNITFYQFILWKWNFSLRRRARARVKFIHFKCKRNGNESDGDDIVIEMCSYIYID